MNGDITILEMLEASGAAIFYNAKLFKLGKNASDEPILLNSHVWSFLELGGGEFIKFYFGKGLKEYG